MPQQWSDKDERQYEHVKSSARARGQKGRAKEIAARTVNKQRRREGRANASNSSSSSRGSSGNGERLADQSKDQLYQRARKLDIAGRSKMNKAQLVRAIRRAA